MRPIVNIKSRNFEITGKILGTGSFSVVKIAHIKENKTTIALKICHCNSESEWLQSLNEICLLQKLVHKNIVTLKSYEITRFHVLIGLDKGENTLKEFISRRNPLEVKVYVISIMGQLINALNFIHGFKIIHGDIKPNNIIYTFEQNELKIQILDFGLSRVAGRADVPNSNDIGGGTINYLAPERLSHSNYNETSDLFSAGIVFFELLFKKHPFFNEGDNYTETMKRKPDPNFPSGYQSEISKDWLIILCSLLSYNPEIRNEARNNDLLKTKSFSNTSIDHQVLALENLSQSNEAEQSFKYTEAAILLMQSCINLGIASHEADTQDKVFLVELNNKIRTYKSKVMSLIYHFRHSYTQSETVGSDSVHDEYYDYLMEVSSSTPKLKHYLDIGYNGELYLKEGNRNLAFKRFMDALNYLNSAMASEPSGDRKIIIGKKMLQWTHIAESLNT